MQDPQVKSLPALVADASAIANLLLETSGEISPEIEALLDQHGVALAHKMDAYYFVTQELEARAQLAKKRADEWMAANSSCLAAVTNIKTRLLLAMKSLELPEIAGNEVLWKRQANPPSTIIEDASRIPGEFITIVHPPPETKIDKIAIKARIQSGEDVPGARLERSERLVPKVAVSAKMKKAGA